MDARGHGGLQRGKEVLGEHPGAQTGLEPIPKGSVHEFDKLLGHILDLSLSDSLAVNGLGVRCDGRVVD
jgi:hypothetical protein